VTIHKCGTKYTVDFTSLGTCMPVAVLMLALGYVSKYTDVATVMATGVLSEIKMTAVSTAVACH